jgi:predicted O-methyltransferase YrrM
MKLAKSIFRAAKYAAYYARAINAQKIHSPFVYELYSNVIKSSSSYYAYDRVEAVRSKMLLSKTNIAVEDFGTGKVKGEKQKFSLSYIASHYVKPKKYGQLLFRLVNHFRPQNILEIGSSLGITTLYLALPNEAAKVITLEGSEETATQARRNFQMLNVSNIELVTGEFSQSLPHVLEKTKKLDFVYFDGNHRKEPTLDYFHRCLTQHHENSVFVFDDIYWSAKMESAWNEIKNNAAVTLTIDLYSIGIVFFRKGAPKQHFVLHY